MVTIPDTEPIIEPINKEWYNGKVANIDMLRLDLVHPIVSGNKWYKLKHNIEYVVSKGFQGVLTFGGAYSNHLIATAAAANYFKIKSVGIVRGEEHNTQLNETLTACKKYGMELVFVSRTVYRKKENWLAALSCNYPNHYIIPEGGANEQGRQGASEIAQYIKSEYSHICISVGTGTTLTGISNALNTSKILGYVPMKGGQYLNEVLKKDILTMNWQLFDQWHFGGFGKSNSELISFMNEFYNSCKIPLDIVYTSKMMYGVKEQLDISFFPANANILCVHTGGLQGNKSVSDKLVY